MQISMDVKEKKKEKKSRKRKGSVHQEDDSTGQTIPSSESNQAAKKLKKSNVSTQKQSSSDENTSQNIENNITNEKHSKKISKSKKLKRNRKKKENQKTKEKESKKIFESLLKPDKNDAKEVLEDDLPAEVDPTKEEEKPVKKQKRKKNVETEKDTPEEKETAPSAKDQALGYLKKWKDDRKSWAFKKVRQVWLMKHMYDSEKIDEDIFSLLLDYLSGIKGAARTRLIKEAESLFEKSDDNSDSAVSDLEKTRARQLLQMLSD